MSEIVNLEYPTIKGHYAVLNIKYRTAQNILNAQIKQVEHLLANMHKKLGLKCDTKDIINSLEGLIQSLTVLKIKSTDCLSAEISAGNACIQTLDHLKKYPEKKEESKWDMCSTASLDQWKKIRLNRMIVEHFLNCGYYKSAKLIAEKTNVYDLTNYQILEKVQNIEKDLAEHKTTKCFEWIEKNKSKLQKINSSLEFKLHVQNFIELIKSDQQGKALEYAKEFFNKFHEQHINEICRCAALLVFDKDSPIELHKEYFKSSRWNDLIRHARMDYYRIHNMPVNSSFNVAFQIGLSSLKTQQCYSNNSKNSQCPVCQNDFNQIANFVPFSEHGRSYLICRVTGLPINENNLAMMLPNGQIYGQMALKQLTKLTAEGKIEIVCPVTSEVFDLKDVEKVFIM